MKRFYLAVLALLITCISFAQVQVTATAATTGPTAYTTVNAAFAAVNAGTHQGAITIAITGTVTEAASAVIHGSGTGGASYTSVLLRPAAGNAATITGSIDGAALIDLDGANNVTIDGINTGGSSMVITNTNTGANAGTTTLRFINDASNNRIQNLSLLGSCTSVTQATVMFAQGLTTGNNNNIITHSKIADAADGLPVNAVMSIGGAAPNTNNTIASTDIANFFAPNLLTAGILLGAGNTGWSILNNKLYQEATRTFTLAFIHRGIQVTSGSGYTISGNVIGYSSAALTGMYTVNGAVQSRYIAIDLAVGTGVATSVQGNIISNFNFVSTNSASNTTGVWCGINIASGDVNVGTLSGNTIGSTTALSSIIVAPTTGGAWVVPITNQSNGIIAIANNNIGGIDLLPNAALSGTINSIIAAGTGGTVNVTNNIIGNNLPNNMRVGVIGTTTGNGNMRGVLSTNPGTVTITGNTIQNLAHFSSNAVAVFRAIEVQAGTATITNNTIHSITANGASVTVATPEGAGILVTSTIANGIIIDNNSITNLSVTNSSTTNGIPLYGIYLAGTNGAVVTRNKIYGFGNASTSAVATAPGVIAGIFMRDANTANPLKIINNMISFGTAQGSNVAMIGVWNQMATAANYSVKIYNNTINIEGTSGSGTHSTFGYYRGDFSATAFSTPSVDIKNNIITNTRTGGTAKHYAIANGQGTVTSNSAGWVANYNLLNAAEPTVGYWSGDVTFSNWKTASGGDANSLSATPVFYVNNQSDLHLVPNTSAGADAKGTPLADVLTDIDNDVRNVVTPDLGADEFTVPFAIHMYYFKGKQQGLKNVIDWKAGCTSASVVFEVQRSNNGRNFTSINSFSATKERCNTPFNFIDDLPLSGNNYYRLKTTEPDGNITYSIIVAILGKDKNFEIVGLMPNLVKSNAVLNVSAASAENLQLLITNASGSVIYKQHNKLSAGSNTININMAHLAAGMYVLTAYTTHALPQVVRFIKQ